MIKNPFSNTRAEPIATASLPDWLAPLPQNAPCGPNLEYDPEYALLMASMTPRGDVQYGAFVDAAEPPNWSEVERDCRRLLLRSRDISIAVLFLRCRTRLAQAQGLREGLALLLALLEQYPVQLHPQLTLDGEFDPVVRANALAALCDPQGLLGDLRAIVIAGASAQRLQVKDVARAFAMPSAPDAMPSEMVRRQLDGLREQRDANLMALSQALQLARRLDQLARAGLAEAAPDLAPLLDVLGWFSDTLRPVSATELTPPDLPQEVATSPGASARQAGESSQDPAAVMIYPAAPPGERQAALQMIEQARIWFELHEPSSPVAILLRQAGKMVGKRYAEVAHCIPLDLLQLWEKS